MKKLLSVLLVMSTLFLTLNFQICFAKCDNYSSQNYEDNQKDVEIQKLKELLKEAENRNEKFENEKLKSKNNKPSFWSKIKSNFSFFFSSYIASSLATATFASLLFGIYCVYTAGHSCYNDKDCKIWGSKKGHNFLSQFKKIDLTNLLKGMPRICIFL